MTKVNKRKKSQKAIVVLVAAFIVIGFIGIATLLAIQMEDKPVDERNDSRAKDLSVFIQAVEQYQSSNANIMPANTFSEWQTFFNSLSLKDSVSGLPYHLAVVCNVDKLSCSSTFNVNDVTWDKNARDVYIYRGMTCETEIKSISSSSLFNKYYSMGLKKGKSYDIAAFTVAEGGAGFFCVSTNN